jgi:hypothetical protein
MLVSLYLSALAMAVPPPPPPASVQGGLEIVWGDAAPDAMARTHPLLVNLAADDGSRIALDPASALRAAGALYRLQGQRVEVVPDALAAQDSYRQSLVSVRSLVSAERGPDALTATSGIAGAQPWVSLLCKFSDNTATPKPLTYFQTMLSNQAGRLDDYWRTVSYGKVNVAGSAAYGWFTLPHPRSYYVPSSGSANLTQLFLDCTAAADATVNFSAFVGVNQMFNDDLDGFAWGGNRYATLDGKSGSWRVTWEPPWGYQHEAPLAHEMGHGFGLPHANNSDRDSDPYDNPWDVMSDNWDDATSDVTFGVQPKHINIYHRSRLGWVDAARQLAISAAGTVSNIQLDAAESSGSTHVQMITVTLPGEPATHYYTLEARQASGIYDGKLASSAVIIHEVDETREEPSWSVDAQVPPADVANDEGSMFKASEVWSAPRGAFEIKIDAANSTGFILNVTRAPEDLIFRNGYQ